jgi:uncharacterized protein YkwD
MNRIRPLVLTLLIALAMAATLLPGAGLRSTAQAAPNMLIDPESQKVVELTNQQRASQGLAPLTVNELLVTAAAGHSTDMATNNFMSHTGSDGSNPGQRITRAGYSWRTYGENVAAGYSTAQSVMDGWMNSSGHRANILNPAFTEIGVAVRENPNSTYRFYWTMVLAAPSGTNPTPVPPTATPRPATATPQPTSAPATATVPPTSAPATATVPPTSAPATATVPPTTPPATATAQPTTPPVSANLALNKSATGSTPCNSNESFAKAFNGSVSGGNSDKWCSLASTKQLQVDLGASTTIGRFVIRHAGAGGESSGYNTHAFTIQISNDGSVWTTVANVTANTANVSSHPITPAAARFVRLNITTPTNNGNTAARIYEFEAYAP